MKPLSWAPPTTLLTAAVSLSAIAQPPMDLGTTVVTATRTAQTVDETLAPVSVVTREDIERLQARSVPELLQGLPGVQVASQGGRGKIASLFLRGTNSDHVLVLIDGVKVGSATAGTTPFEHLPVSQIERIEVVRGPRSSLYGSEAIGGVIQIFTRKGGGGIRPHGSIAAGSHGTYEASAGVSGGGDRAWYHLGVSGVETDGFDACSGDPITFRGCGADEPDADGYRRSSGSLRAGYLLPGGVEVEAHALRAEGENHFDGFFNASDTVQQVIGAKAAFTTLSDWRISLKAGRSRDELDSFSDGVFQERFDTERDSLTLQGDYRPGTGNVVTLGVDYQEDRVDTTQVTRESARDNRAVFGQYLGRWGEHSLQAALRHDDNEQFGSHTTGSLAWGFAIRPGWEISASYGTAFKAPTFLDLYFVNFGGNPDLEPERSRTAELGLRGSLPWGSLQLNAFATEIDDLITFDNRSFTPVNLEKARIRGVEADVDTTLAGWDMDVALTLLNPEDRSPGSACDLLLRRPEQTLRVDASRGLGRYRIGATVLAEGRRFDLGCERVGGYATLDLRAEVQLAPGWHLQGKLANMLDKDYETLDFYNEPGRTFLVTLRYAPGA